jgi:hypothetical protein
MRFKHTQVWGFEGALHGMRNPKNSWGRSDSHYDEKGNYIIGPNDMKLAQTLAAAGPEHRKFLRMIHVQVDVTAPLFWWKEADTYKVATVANSTSTMHKIQSAPITLECFEIDDYDKKAATLMSENDADPETTVPEEFINYLEILRQKYIETKDKRYWKELIRWLPESWLQTRTFDLNYETIRSMCLPTQRRNHKLTEWSEAFISWARTLPYAQEFLFADELEK